MCWTQKSSWAKVEIEYTQQMCAKFKPKLKPKLMQVPALWAQRLAGKCDSIASCCHNVCCTKAVHQPKWCCCCLWAQRLAGKCDSIASCCHNVCCTKAVHQPKWCCCCQSCFQLQLQVANHDDAFAWGIGGWHILCNGAGNPANAWGTLALEHLFWCTHL